MGGQQTAKKLLADELVEIAIPVRDIVNGQRPLIALASSKLPVTLAYKISKSVRVLDREIEVYNKKREEILERLGKLEGAGKDAKYVFAGDNEKAADNELNAILDNTIVIKIIKIKLQEFQEILGYELEPGTLALLDWLIVD